MIGLLALPRRLRRGRSGPASTPVEISRGANAAAASESPVETPRSLAARLLLVPIHLYRRFISPALPPACRFTPTCSQYAVEAVSRHGALKGGWLAIKRLGRCHPWHPGGEDPVP